MTINTNKFMNDNIYSFFVVVVVVVMGVVVLFFFAATPLHTHTQAQITVLIINCFYDRCSAWFWEFDKKKLQSSMRI